MEAERISRPTLLQNQLRQLRWLLTGYHLGGPSYWPRAAKACLSFSQSFPSDTSKQDPASTLAVLQEEIGNCLRCRLHESRTNLVFGDGSPVARLVFVGEAPGYEEDRQGLPFVGRAGQLLDKMIQAIGMRRSEVYICNVVKCRPPQNRNPDTDEVAACSPFLIRQIEAIHPMVICLLGTYAAQTLLQTSLSISQLRGKPRYWHGIPVVATFHPAYLLRNPAQKASVWSDLIQVVEQIKSANGSDSP